MSFEQGLIHTVKLIELTESGSGYGTIEEGYTEVATDLKARFTKFDGEDEQNWQGRGSEKMWRVVLEYTELLESGTKYALVWNDERYDIVNFITRKNTLGEKHHISIEAEYSGDSYD